jgi:hypothetical protein
MRLIEKLRKIEEAINDLQANINWVSLYPEPPSALDEARIVSISYLRKSAIHLVMMLEDIINDTEEQTQTEKELCL